MRRIPYRITLLPSSLTLPADQASLQPAAALLLFITLFEHLLRHPDVSCTDTDDFRVDDGQGRLLDAQHPSIANVKRYEFAENRRDEVLWFELSLDASHIMPIRLFAERFGKSADVFEVPRADDLGAALGHLLAQWLAARGIAPAPRPFPSFTAPNLLAVTAHGHRLLAQAQGMPQGQFPELTLPPFLQVPFCRWMGTSLGITVDEPILRIEPDHPWALRDAHLALWHRQKGVGRDAIRQILKLAPGWGKPYGLMWGEGVKDDETLYHRAIDAILLPANYFATQQWADFLYTKGRWEEAFRVASDTARKAPFMLSAHYTAMAATNDLGRYGAALADATARLDVLAQLEKQGRFGGAEPDVCIMRLRLADALCAVGRLEEAIEVREKALGRVFNPGNWPKMRAVLDKWKTDTTVLHFAYAKEGYYRGDPGRAVAGSSRGTFEYFDQLQVYIESLIAVGKPELALCAHSHYAHIKPGNNVYAHLAGARANLANGRLSAALDALVAAPIRAPQAPLHGELERLLRLTASLPAAEWEQSLTAKLQMGAARLARQSARDAADFHPGLSGSAVVAQALGAQTPVPLDTAALAALASRLDVGGSLGRIDALFATHTQGTLAAADALVDGWVDTCDRPAAPGGPAESRFAQQLLYVLGQALCRYLSATTQAPSVLSGGYRQVATQALCAIAARQGAYDDGALRALFEAIEKHASVDPWLFDAWLLRLERALDLDRSRGGHTAHLVAGLPRVAYALRGDEGIWHEHNLAVDLAKEAGKAAASSELYERTLRAVGGNVASQWSDVATGLPPALAVDVHHTAYAANPFNAGPAVNLARVLIPSASQWAAFDLLADRLGYGGNEWRAKQAKSLEGLWKLPVPLDWQACQTQGLGALRAGRFDEAIACLRWCDALDPGNNQTLQNLALAYAGAGRVDKTLAVFGELDAKQAPVWAAQALYNAGRKGEAILVYRYAVLGGGSAELLLQFAAIAYAAEDDEATAEAYAEAEKHTALDGPALNAYAGVLDNLGRYEDCERVARRMLEVAGQDRLIASSAYHHYACSLLGRGRGAEGIQPAQTALQMNPEPANTAVFQETLQRCQQQSPRPVTPTRSSTPEARAFGLLARGDLAQVTQQTQGQASFGLQRAGLSAAEFRSEAENDIPVTPRALEAARRALASSSGRVEPDAALLRAHALRIRENALYAIDPPPVLSRRLTPEQLADQITRRMLGAPAPSLSLAGMHQLSAQAVQQKGWGGAPKAAFGAAAAAPAGSGPVEEQQVLPGTKLPRLVDYVALMKAMRGGDVMGSLAKFGIDMGSYGQLAAQWAAKMQADPRLTERFGQLMSR